MKLRLLFVVLLYLGVCSGRPVRNKACTGDVVVFADSGVVKARRDPCQNVGEELNNGIAEETVPVAELGLTLMNDSPERCYFEQVRKTADETMERPVHSLVTTECEGDLIK